ncbi:MAG TPA: hypothetical protein EYP36_10885 [Calditrichaeota bacterium]|nr:hypothetical protein [Calditrichota bacterium]
MTLTIEDLKIILQTNSRMTIFRKLKQIPYKSSYSHCGKYYTLDTMAQYDKYGVWGYGNVFFSKYGTLKNTVLVNIENCKTGLTACELEDFLHIPVYNTALDLYKTQQVKRKQIGKEYVYLSLQGGKAQFALRKKEIQSRHSVVKDDTEEYLALFMSLLNERQKRLFAGYESLKLGYGGDKQIAKKNRIKSQNSITRQARIDKQRH